VGEEGGRGGVGPVDVGENDDEGVLQARAREQIEAGALESMPGRVGIVRSRRRRSELRHEPGDLAASSVEAGVERVGVGLSNEELERLDDRLVRRGPHPPPAPPEHQHAPPPPPPCQPPQKTPPFPPPPPP